MVFKNFRFLVIIRVTILTLAVSLLAWCLVHALYLRSVYLAAGVLILLAELIWFIDRFNRDFRTFMVSLLQRDFTTHYQASGKGRSFNELYEALNNISGAFKAISAEKEVQHRYLEMLVEHLRVGILCIDADGKVHLANQALKDLLQKDVILSLRSLESFDDSFVRTLHDIRTGETQLVKLRVNNELLQVSLHASEFKLGERYYKLISMQNIRSELDAREIEAWQKLIRVLSHEIMNSVAPIISLSGTLHGLVDQNMRAAPQYDALHQGLDAIKIRSEGLYNFTQSYRKLSGIPKLSLKQVNIKDLVGRVHTLMQHRLETEAIQFRVSEVDATIVADPELMEHVLINLVLNAIDALAGRPDAAILIRTSRHPKGNICIHIADNGEGMDERTAEKIFIPFFTTRKSGSGIGLAITKQILQLHHADIQFHTERGKGTEFIIVL